MPDENNQTLRERLPTVSVGAEAAPPAPLEIEEDPEYKIKRWEELLALVKLGNDQARERWDAIEEKTMKYATLLGVIVAAGAIGGFGEVARVLGHRRDWLDGVFLFAYGSVGVVAVAAFICFVWALRLQTITEPPLGRSLLGHVASHNYVDVLYSMSVRFVETTEQLNDGSARKTRWAAWGYRGVLAVLVCAIISTVAYVAIKTRDEVRQNPPTTNQSHPSARPAEPSPTSPNPNVSAPAGQTFQKGIEGGTAPRPTTPPRREQ
jgi:hypothetical protein